MRLIRTTFARTTPESVEAGDHSETGWIDEEGESMETEHGNPVDSAIQFLHYAGACHASDSHPCERTWYSTESQCIDWATGEEEERSFHLVGFTLEECLAIFQAVTSKPAIRP